MPFLDMDEYTHAVGPMWDQSYGRLARELYTRKQLVMARPSGTVLDVVNVPTAFTVEGTPTNSDDAFMPFVRFTTSTTINTDAGLLPGAFNIFTRSSWSPDFRATVKLGATLTTYRLIVGLVSVDPMGIAPATLTGLSGSFFRYDTGADGTAFWRCVSNDGGADAGNADALTSGIAGGVGAIVASQTYELRIRVVSSQGQGPGKVLFFINNRKVMTQSIQLSVNLPVAATYLAPHAEVRCLAGTAARAFDLSYMSLYSQPYPP